MAAGGAALTGAKEGPIRAAELAGSATSSVLTGAGAETGTAAVLAEPRGATPETAAAGALPGGGAAEAGGAAAAAA